MVKDGNFIKPPPPDKCIETKTSKMNLQDFTSMDSKIGFGSILNLQEFERKFKSPKKEFESSNLSEAQNLLQDNEDNALLQSLKELTTTFHEIQRLQDEINGKENDSKSTEK